MSKEKERLTTYQIVRRFTGAIDPVGCSRTDEDRYDNLEDTILLMNCLIEDLASVAKNRTRYEASMKKAGEKAYQFFVNYDISDWVDCDE